MSNAQSPDLSGSRSKLDSNLLDRYLELALLPKLRQLELERLNQSYVKPNKKRDEELKERID